MEENLKDHLQLFKEQEITKRKDLTLREKQDQDHKEKMYATTAKKRVTGKTKRIKKYLLFIYDSTKAFLKTFF